MKTLVAYATKNGSTVAVAEAIAEELRATGNETDVLPIQEVKGLSQYQALVIGSPTRMGKLLSEATDFAKRQSQAIARMHQTAYFTTGITMKHDTPENREKATAFLKPLCDIKEPVSLGTFAGKVDYSQIGAMWRFVASRDKSGQMAEGDFRDWQAIRAWAKDVAAKLG